MANDPRYVEVKAVAADGLIAPGPVEYWGGQVSSNGTDAAFAVIYDNNAASGKIVDYMSIGASAVGTNTPGGQLNKPVLCHNGIYADITTVGQLVVWYRTPTED